MARKSYKSKGQRPNVRKDIRKALRRDYLASGDQLLNKLDAHLKGKRVMEIVPNIDKSNTKERFIRLPYDIALQIK